MPRSYVKTGVWELYGEPFHKRWVWTLEDSDAFWLLGLYVITLAFVQQRAWSILRYYGALWKSPVGFKDRANPLLKLSQTQALRDSIIHFQMLAPQYLGRLQRFALKAFGRKTNLSELDLEETIDGGTIPWLFGFLALVNGLGFLSTGILLPLFLTNGIEVPVVRSLWTPSCDRRRFDYLEVAAMSHSSALYQLCWDPDELSILDTTLCSGFAIEGLNFTIENKDCPFPEDICFTDTTAGRLDTSPDPHSKPRVLTIKHHNITLRQLGLNSRSTVKINYELACSPLRLEDFIYPIPEGGSTLSFRDFGQNDSLVDNSDARLYSEITWPNDTLANSSDANLDDDYPVIWEDYMFSLQLETLNGPNKWTNVSSGTLVALGNTSMRTGEVSVIPMDGYYWTLEHIPGGVARVPLHPFITADDSKFFAIVYIAGSETSSYTESSDPVLRGHINIDGMYLEHPDFEATAIGCMEKYQFCQNTAGKLQCTAWSRLLDRLQELETPAPSGNLLDEGWEPPFTFKDITRELSFYMKAMRYLDSFPTEGNLNWTNQIVPVYLENWWQVLYRIQMVAIDSKETHQMDWPPPGYSGDDRIRNQEEADRWLWCHRVLLREPDYTNVNFFGFVVSLVLVLLICVISYWDWLRASTSWFSNSRPLEGALYYSRRFFARLFVRFSRPKKTNSGAADFYNMNNIGFETGDPERGPNLPTGTIQGMAAAHMQEVVVGTFHDYDNPLPMAARDDINAIYN